MTDCSNKQNDCPSSREHEPADTTETAPERAHDGSERRGQDRRDVGQRAEADEADRRSGWDRRRGPGRRRSDDRRAAEEGEMDDEQFEFIMAIDAYKRTNSRAFPTYTEILEIAKALGYRKVAEPQPLNAVSKD